MIYMPRNLIYGEWIYVYRLITLMKSFILDEEMRDSDKTRFMSGILYFCDNHLGRDWEDAGNFMDWCNEAHAKFRWHPGDHNYYYCWHILTTCEAIINEWRPEHE